MQYNKLPRFWASTTDAQNIITHYLVPIFYEITELGKNSVSSNRNFMGIYFKFLCADFVFFLMNVS